MNDLFLHIFNISMTAGWIVLAALVLRMILRDRLPGWVRCALWGVAGVRLLFPVSWESIVSLIPSAEPVPPAITTAPVPSVNVGIPVVDAVINPVISQTMTPTPEYSVNPMQIAVAVGAAVWLVGVAAMLIYYVISTVRLHRRLAVSIPYRDNVYLCDHLPGPILVGVFRPRIYIPSGTDPKLYPHILAHEGNHLKRGDHVWKPLGFLLLSVYWINPLLWVAYVLLSRDMERACDEKTINGMSEDERIAYYLALVACSERKPTRQLPNPVGFGEHKIIERVKHMKKYKKPTVWATALCVLLIAAAAVCFLTNPVSAAETDDPTTPPNGQETTGIELEGDSELILSLTKYLQEFWNDYDMPPTSVELKIDEIKKGKQPLLVDFDPLNYYFVCGYYDATHDGDEASNYCCVTEYTWVRFANANEITERYKGENIVVAFQINKAASVKDIQSETADVPNVEHFQMYTPNFDNGVNTNPSMLFDQVFIYLNSSDKSNVYHSVSVYNHEWVTLPCVKMDGQVYIMVPLYTIRSNGDRSESNTIVNLGKYYDGLMNIMESEPYGVTRDNGATNFYGLFEVGNFVNCVIKD